MQFDVYTNLDKDSNRTYPYFVDIQNNLLDALNSRVVIPLTPLKNVGKNYPQNLCPTIFIENRAFALLAHQITSVPLSLLKKKAGSVAANRADIAAAIDFVVVGI